MRYYRSYYKTLARRCPPTRLRINNGSYIPKRSYLTEGKSISSEPETIGAILNGKSDQGLSYRILPSYMNTSFDRPTFAFFDEKRKRKKIQKRKKLKNNEEQLIGYSLPDSIWKHFKILADENQLAINTPVNITKVVPECTLFSNEKDDKPVSRNQLPSDPQPSTSILHIINSVDKSTVIIHKDLYITNRILEKIKEKKEPVINEKLETKTKNQEITVKDIQIEKDLSNELTYSQTAIPEKLEEKTIGVIAEKINTKSEQTPNPILNHIKDNENEKTKTIGAFLAKKEVDKESLALESPVGIAKENETIGEFLFKNDNYRDPLVHNNEEPISTIKLEENETEEIKIENQMSSSSINVIRDEPEMKSNNSSAGKKTGGSFKSDKGDATVKKPETPVEVKTTTTITSVKDGENAEIMVFEVRKFVDKRLPFPFVTENLVQSYGAENQMSDIIGVVDRSRADLIRMNGVTRPDLSSITDLIEGAKMKEKVGSGTIVPLISIDGKKEKSMILKKAKQSKGFTKNFWATKNKDIEKEIQITDKQMEEILGISEPKSKKSKRFKSKKSKKEKPILELKPLGTDPKEKKNQIVIKNKDDIKKALSSRDQKILKDLIAARSDSKKKSPKRKTKIATATTMANDKKDDTPQQVKPKEPSAPPKQETPIETKKSTKTTVSAQPKQDKKTTVVTQAKQDIKTTTVAAQAKQENKATVAAQKQSITKATLPDPIKTEALIPEKLVTDQKQNNPLEREIITIKGDKNVHEKHAKKPPNKKGLIEIIKIQANEPIIPQRIEKADQAPKKEEKKLKVAQNVAVQVVDPNAKKNEKPTMYDKFDKKGYNFNNMYDDAGFWCPLSVSCKKELKEMFPMDSPEPTVLAKIARECKDCEVCKDCPGILTFPMLYSDRVDEKVTFDLLKRHGMKAIPSVTKILNSTMSDSSHRALDSWKNQMVTELGYEGFQSLYKEQLQKSEEFRSAIQNYLNAEKKPLAIPNEACLQSIKHVLSDIKEVYQVDSNVFHSRLAYKGVLDCIVKYKNKTVVMEWKRSDKPKPSLPHTFDAPLQLCAYIGALNYDKVNPIKVDGGVVVVAYSDGRPADTFELTIKDCDTYWKSWLQRYKHYVTNFQEISISTTA